VGHQVLSDSFGKKRSGYELEIIVAVDLTSKIKLRVYRDFYDDQSRYEAYLWMIGLGWQSIYSLNPFSVDLPSVTTMHHPCGDAQFDTEFDARSVAMELFLVSLKIINKAGSVHEDGVTISIEDRVRDTVLEHLTPLD
jgi:hypothetical protein